MNVIFSEHVRKIGRIKLFVFDFDCTITNYHLSEDDLKKPTSEILDVDLFRSCVYALIEKNITVAIASYNSKHIILNIMDKIFPERIFNQMNVITPRDVPPVNGKQWRDMYVPPSRTNLNKNTMLEILRIRYQLNRSDMYLMDDNHGNVKLAKEIGYMGVTVPKDGGFKKSVQAFLDAALS